MTTNSFPDFSDRSRPRYLPDEADSAAARLVQHLHQPGAWSTDGWDPTPLDVACRTVAGNRNGSIPRIHSVFPCPEVPGGAIPVVEYARALAATYGLRVHCTLSGGMIRVTFEQTGAGT